MNRYTPHHGHQADNFLHLGPMIHQLATDDIRPTQLLAAWCDDRDHGCQISSRHATPLQGIHHPIMTFRLRTRITLKHQTNQISTITLIREWSSVQSISVHSSPVQSSPGFTVTRSVCLINWCPWLLLILW